MVKAALGTRLLRSLARAGKTQQRQVSKLVKLFAVPAPKPPRKTRSKAAKLLKPVSVVTPVKPLKPVKLVPRPAAPAANTAPPKVRQHVSALPGKWLASHYAEATYLAKQRMSYWLYLPDHVPPEAVRDGMPLIVMLHGCHQTATQFAQGTRMNRLAEEQGYAVVYPQQSVSSQAQRCWKWFDRATQEGGGDVPMIVGIVNKVGAQYRIDRQRIYVGGLSAGAGMANIVALNHPELIAAVGLHSGPVFGAGHSTIGALGVMQHGAGMRVDGAIRELLAKRPAFPGMPTILIQGDGDKVVRPINQSQLVQQTLLLNGLPPATPARVLTKPAGRSGSRNAHEIRDFYVGRKLLLRVAQIADLDHAWSGGDGSLSFNSHAGPDASQMMLDFFARHQRRRA